MTDTRRSPDRCEITQADDALASARVMAFAAGYGDHVAMFIIARARRRGVMPEGTA